ncbi:uncharacterized protein LOC136043710 [Artemia franciscana]|uniref:Uncharacterized protein n=1 Tax=Artemia franciscana TaxID=6661 RepID=A0AA88H9D1_ARTSF|nr:hypothetical protein QYM36_020030 [Artemia franciscana]
MSRRLRLIFILFLLFQNKRTISKCLPFKELVLEKISMENECLIKYIRNLKLFLPSRLPYNFTNVRTNAQRSVSPKISPVQSIIQNKGAPWIEALIATEILVPKEGQRNFLEYRAFDGLTFSATLHLERFLQWTGVLIEPDDQLYSDMESVNRKSYGIHACISPNEHPCNAFIKPLLNSIPKVAYTTFHHMPTVLKTGEVVFNQNALHVLCIPLYSIMLAVNMIKIDLFLLAAEDAEMNILETIPFDIVSIAVFMIEVGSKSEDQNQEIHKFLESKKYTFYDRFSDGIYRTTDIFISQKYLENNYDWRKLLRSTVKDIYKILTGNTDEEISDNEIELLEILF